ncbi:polysaccharide deacetylase family protein [Anaerocolumna xylanovorans]|uniref:Peptidoglycan/xylan/chitin deacetylase, PgdA/CDA1 family n=1 Tax=Anaerocolumna xylanovorans DSM 12503 TaxID=1121345 RepID=A0A1M7YMZ5_9FIRM|nr:polysaccharide deacetylase family protein [Anaerocolumna xylanovorans]SHO53952.1 Peptidoglycan/xylan/chitin deacetylase, PgdA/CDA1 family [Anaerocolumna xylanovorans DSM 12503]
MKTNLKKQIAFAIIILCAIAIAAGILFLKQKGIGESLAVSQKYNAEKDIEEAMDKLKSGTGKADIITDVQTTDNVVALNFKGMSSTETNKEILKLLKQHGIKSTFFLPGIQAAEDSFVVKEMVKDGHRVESNTLTGTKNLEKEEQKELVTDFCRTNNILESITGRAPELLMCNSTEYTEKLLEAAEASGYKAAVNGSRYLSYQSFKNYEQVLAYVKALDGGTILTVKLDGPLEKDEYTKDEKPAPDKQADTDITEPENSSLPEEERLVQVVGWLLKALDEVKVQAVFTADIENYQDEDFQKDFTDYREKNNGKLAEVYTRITTDKNLLSFSFGGIGDKEKLREILDFLKKNNLKATFFVNGDDLLNNRDSIRTIIEQGHQIGNGGLTGKDITSGDFNEICFEIYKWDKLLKENYGIAADVFMPAYGKYNDTVREAVSALGYKLVSYSKNPITDNNMTLQEIKSYYKNGFSSGDVIFFRLDYYSDILKAVTDTYELAVGQKFQFVSVKALLASHSVMTAENSDTSKPTNNTPSTGNGKNPSESSTENEQEKNIVKQLRERNKGKLAVETSTVFTTDKMLSYTFTGISNTKTVEDVLDKLKKLGAKGTFFVTEEETGKYASVIKKISDGGHEIEICLNPSREKDFDTVCKSILAVQKAVAEICGQKPALVRCAYVIDMPKEMLEAISSTGCRVVWQDLNFVSSFVGKNGTFKDVANYVYNEGNISAKRGEIVFFRLDYYKDTSLIGKLLVDFTKKRVDTIAYSDNGKYASAYEVKPLKELLACKAAYAYPAVSGSILTSVKDKIYPGHLSDLSGEELFDALKKRYIGNPDIVSAALPGFTEDELTQLNKEGTFTEDKVLFLTFDDWGSDKPVNQLLYVLQKYHVKANFFIRTNYLTSNPNLLRAIAEGGHDVGSHTDEHLPFADSKTLQAEDDVKGEYTSITKREAAKRKADLQLSYNKLLSVIGDVEVGGKPALTTIFRPPTLAMSKLGMEAILDMGFSHIVSGDFDPHDYAAKDAQELADRILNGIKLEDGSVRGLNNGSVIVLHMSDDSSTPNNKNDITAEALDIVIPKLLQQGYSFARLSRYLSGK